MRLEEVHVGDWVKLWDGTIGKVVCFNVGTRYPRVKTEAGILKGVPPEELARIPDQDSGADLVGRICWVWRDGYFKKQPWEVINYYDRCTYMIGEPTGYAHARPIELGHPDPSHPNYIAWVHEAENGEAERAKLETLRKKREDLGRTIAEIEQRSEGALSASSGAARRRCVFPDANLSSPT